jgi:hypothetical protein
MSRPRTSAGGPYVRARSNTRPGLERERERERERGRLRTLRASRPGGWNWDWGGGARCSNRQYRLPRLLCPASRPRAFVRSAGSGGGALLLLLPPPPPGGGRAGAFGSRALPRAVGRAGTFLSAKVRGRECGGWEVKKRRPRRRERGREEGWLGREMVSSESERQKGNWCLSALV